MEEISIQSDHIKLDQFLKWAGIAQTGGHAKILISDGFIEVNGDIENRRSRKLQHGDQINVKNAGNYKIVRE
jgi:ribosome-associated protein